MNAISRRIQELHAIRPVTEPPDDLEQYWAAATREATGSGYHAERSPEPTPMGMQLHHVVYEGFADTPIHGRLMLPLHASAEAPVPCLIAFPGYHGGPISPELSAYWISLGVGVLAVDVRGQGGESGNRLGSSFGMTMGWITEGILDRERTYYRAVAIDALRAADWLLRQPEVDTARVGTFGASQGGGLSLLVSALDARISLTIADIPNLCHLDYGLFHSTSSLTELQQFLRLYPQHLETVLRHLNDVDMVHLAPRLHAPLLMSVGLKDTICMPEQIFPVYHAASSAEKHLEIYPFTGHAVEAAQRQRAMDFAVRHWLES
ncbi:acetylxylan esterase [Paenibacillus sp. SYP-B4298]|uniref:acetylxylan esterase n=1 Tax=Paenibacillus sp. SYP-B4298 TaxID=2996034 RepID=UPI0022DE720A|nr:acetylxylan esterase [Paenibacillus sp. SYP-B4298]